MDWNSIFQRSFLEILQLILLNISGETLSTEIISSRSLARVPAVEGFNKNSCSYSTESIFVECSMRDMQVELHSINFSLKTLDANIGFMPSPYALVVEVTWSI